MIETVHNPNVIELFNNTEIDTLGIFRKSGNIVNAIIGDKIYYYFRHKDQISKCPLKFYFSPNTNPTDLLSTFYENLLNAINDSNQQNFIVNWDFFLTNLNEMYFNINELNLLYSNISTFTISQIIGKREDLKVDSFNVIEKIDFIAESILKTYLYLNNNQ